MELPIRVRRRREKGKIRRLTPLHMCVRTLITTVTIVTLMVM
jgi:hypothetical protein